MPTYWDNKFFGCVHTKPNLAYKVNAKWSTDVNSRQSMRMSESRGVIATNVRKSRLPHKLKIFVCLWCELGLGDIYCDLH